MKRSWTPAAEIPTCRKHFSIPVAQAVASQSSSFRNHTSFFCHLLGAQILTIVFTTIADYLHADPRTTSKLARHCRDSHISSTW